MKHIHVYALVLMSVLLTSYGQSKTDRSKENINPIAIGYKSKDPVTSYVWDIEQDRKGNIWFATSDGVFRYDARLPARAGSDGNDGVGQGKSFTNITGKLISKPVFSIFEDRKGNFWFGTYGAGVFYYDGKSLPTGQAGFQNFTTKDGLASNSVMPIYEDKDGIIWLGTGGGVSRYDPSATLRTGSKSFQNFTTSGGLTNNDVHAIVQDKAGKIWFGTRREISIYDARLPAGKRFTTLTDKHGKTFTNVWSMVKDKKGNIWFGADGLWRYDGRAFTKINETGSGVIVQDKEGNILAGSGGSIFRYDQQTLSDKKPHVTEIKTNAERGALHNLPFGILGANDGSIWFSSPGGVSRYDGKTITEFTVK
jgi:ligand-binding sensor domain-containing protein